MYPALEASNNAAYLWVPADGIDAHRWAAGHIDTESVVDIETSKRFHDFTVPWFLFLFIFVQKKPRLMVDDNTVSRLNGRIDRRRCPRMSVFHDFNDDKNHE